MLRRLHSEQPASFAFTPANMAWAEAQITKYPEGRQASAIIPLLWRAQEQEGWLTKPAIEYVADLLGMAYIRALEVATFYFMFQLQPVGSVAHIQVCGTTTCMICGAEDLIAVCKDKIAPKAHMLSDDGKFSWEEVECLGACANAPMAQIGKDYYEDLTAKRLGEIIDELAKGAVPVPGPQNGRFSSEPSAGLVVLTEWESGRTQYNASAQRAVDIGDTVKRIDGTEVPLTAPWQGTDAPKTSKKKDAKAKADAPRPAKGKPADATGVTEQEAKASSTAKPDAVEAPVLAAEGDGKKPQVMDAARDGGPDDLKMIKGVGPKLEGLLHELGVFHFDQVAAWGPEEVAWVDQNLVGFKGRVSRDNWVVQARQLAKGEMTEFASRVKKGGVYDDE
ncbi:NADH-quinone oxidoreductase subunit E [Pseudooceanicola nanhaiensis]|uniref:NADH-quinone oxidoreductase subunit E n=1 Tax=Pseudooceanicola nanhaiensis TaxID=375761 RepID=UPI001CD6C055|nr:NADH-quinone oxidoreductase subunit E [Pseudooceanicola nanhaiensis]MCA0921054.1 NADH-quinone oxidoreductase subunit E [Pseudooceanicola nanhaiensis]